MVDELISAYGNNFMVAALGVALGLLCLFIVLWLLRNRAPSPFVRGGRNRQPRLQVLDAAAVDTRRRIVLIRRDNVEHLVMIGGPTDIVIESGIGDERGYLASVAMPAAAHPAAAPIAAVEAPMAAPQELAAPARPAIAEPAPQMSMPAAPAVAIPQKREAAQPERRPQPTSPEMRNATIAPVAVAQAQAAPASPAIPATVPAPTVQAVAPAAIRPAAQPAAQASEPPAQPVATPEPRVEPATAAAVLTLAAAIPEVSPARTAPLRAEPDMARTVEGPVIEPVQPQFSAVSITTPSRPAQEEASSSLDTVPEPTGPSEKAAVTFDMPTVELETSGPTIVTVTQEPSFEVDHAPLSGFDAPSVSLEPSSPLPLEQPDNTTRMAPMPRIEPAVAPEPQVDIPNIEAVLDAARQKVLMPEPRREEVRPFEPERFGQKPPAPHVVSTDEPKRDISEFERVLEEEMALHLAASPAATPATPISNARANVSQIVPDVLTETPRLPADVLLGERRQGSTDETATATDAPNANEPSLQNEIARIFGEMSASRNP